MSSIVAVDIFPADISGRTFTGTNQSNLEKQIENYAKRNGANVYGNFIRSINETSDLGVTDGNPLAATAIFARQAYSQFGLMAIASLHLSRELRVMNEVLDEGDNAASELRCQLDERKCDGAPENNIEYYIDECSHVNVSRRDAHHIQP